MANIIKQGTNVIKVHLKHLESHGEHKYLKEALKFLRENKIKIPQEFQSAQTERPFGGCPGMRVMDFGGDDKIKEDSIMSGQPSSLRQWPIQLHLVSPLAPYYQNKDVLLSADCVAYAKGDFHSIYLKGKSLAIACPKLDANKDIYMEKLISMIDEAKINTLTVMIMEVPCCSGLLMLAKEALSRAKRKVPLKCIVVGIKGEILSEEWITL
jgi:hypothetical protein